MAILHAITGNVQWLDGGAMFGNVPRALWERWCPPDERGRIELACRGLLVDEGDRKILLETGIGAFFEPKLRERYGVVEGRHVLLDSLAAAGAPHESIDVVVLSHLHFDHAGGLLAAHREGAGLELLFPRATFVVGDEALARARAPHPRDRASFVPGLVELLEASGRLEVVADRSPTLGDRWRFVRSEGHTPGMLHARYFDENGGSVFFCADLAPGRPWVHLPVTMGYDRWPERLIDEKTAVFEELLRDRAWLFFTHDARIAAARLTRSEDGRYGTTDERDVLGPGFRLAG